ncbi:MAG: DUF4131 domain-containing protein, partial [Clostridiales Family XIII bacterium]|nr:DUF4131 domain-containing protein [Clostridiales Family XIII bacterium]
MTVFLIYALIIIFADYLGYFSYKNQSKLYNIAKNNKIVSLEGTVLSEPQILKNNKKFILKTYNVNGNTICEKISVNSPKAYSVNYGDTIYIEGRLKIPQSFSDFDYQKY